MMVLTDRFTARSAIYNATVVKVFTVLDAVVAQIQRLADNAPRKVLMDTAIGFHA